jgi:hypothetical protein
MPNSGGGSPGIKPPKTSPSQFMGSRLFPEPLTDRMFQPFLHDFLLRPPASMPFNMGQQMNDLHQELDTAAITTKIKEKLSTHNLGQKVL